MAIEWECKGLHVVTKGLEHERHVSFYEEFEEV